MKKISIAGLILSCFIFLTGMASVPPVSYSPEVNASFDQLKNELQQKGIDIQRITDAANPIKDLLAEGVKKEDLKKFVLDLSSKNLDQDSFKNSLASVSELVKNGEQYRKARSLISSTIDKAQKQGLQGKALTSMVRGSLDARKMQLNALKKENLAKAQEIKGGSAKPSQDAQATVKTPPQAGAAPVVSARQPANDVVKDLDNALRPVFVDLFGDARIVSESRVLQTKTDGEVVENRLVYKVKKILAIGDGKALHPALLAAGFSSSPRLGSKPSEWRGTVAMSLFRTTSLRPYSLVIHVDTNKQQITVESYKLGSKYDQLM